MVDVWDLNSFNCLSKYPIFSSNLIAWILAYSASFLAWSLSELAWSIWWFNFSSNYSILYKSDSLFSSLICILVISDLWRDSISCFCCSNLSVRMWAPSYLLLSMFKLCCFISSNSLLYLDTSSSDFSAWLLYSLISVRHLSASLAA